MKYGVIVWGLFRGLRTKSVGKKGEEFDQLQVVLEPFSDEFDSFPSIPVPKELEEAARAAFVNIEVGTAVVLDVGLGRYGLWYHTLVGTQLQIEVS